MRRGLQAVARPKSILQTSCSFQFYQTICHVLVSSMASGTTDTKASAVTGSGSFENVQYASSETAEVEHWIAVAEAQQRAQTVHGAPNQTLRDLDAHLSTRTTLLGSKPSKGDLILYRWLRPIVADWTPEQRTGENGYHHIVRYIDFVQNSPLFNMDLSDSEKVKVNPDEVIAPPKAVDPKEEKEKKKKEKATAAAAGSQTQDAPESPSPHPAGGSKADGAEAEATAEGNVANQAPLAHRPKKEKQPKAAKQVPQKAPATPAGPSPSLIDLRVGHILKAVNHPNADSLYVSTIACGDEPGTDNTSTHEGQVVRTVCSGLNGLVPLEEMQDRKVVVICNLKPVTMRGVKSAAMVLAASPRLGEGEEDHHKGPVELVSPPAEAKAGEKVWFEGWEGEPEGVLNPKKKVWEMVQPGFTTTEDLRVAFDLGAAPQVAEARASSDQPQQGLSPLRTRSGGYCTVSTLQMAVVR